MNYQKLFNYLSDLGITPIESEMYEIERIVLESLPAIKCKALRKKGTDLYYYYDSYLCEYCPDKIPIPFTGDFDNASNNDEYFPEDAILIDIEIHIPA